jgi:hypothetical protein
MAHMKFLYAHACGPTEESLITFSDNSNVLQNSAWHDRSVEMIRLGAGRDSKSLCKFTQMQVNP